MTLPPRVRLLLPILLPALFLVAAVPAVAGQVEGQVLGPAGVTPLTNATVTFYNLTTSSSYNSEPSGADGSYVVSDLPAGSYDIAVQTSRGLWLVEKPLALGEGEMRNLSFSLRELAYWEGTDRPPERTVPSDENIVGRAVILDSTGTDPATPSGRKRKIWTGVGIGLGVLALALLAGDDSSNSEASPFTP